jgi:hypothetical protein
LIVDLGSRGEAVVWFEYGIVGMGKEIVVFVAKAKYL